MSEPQIEPLSDAEYLNLLGLLPLNTSVAAVINTVWKLYAPKALIAPRLRYLYATRDLLKFQLGRISRRGAKWEQANVTEDGEAWAKNLKDLLKETEDEIQLLEGQARGNRPPVVMQTAATAARFPLTSYSPDPNSPVLEGDPRYSSMEPRK